MIKVLDSVCVCVRSDVRKRLASNLVDGEEVVHVHRAKIAVSTVYVRVITQSNAWSTVWSHAEGPQLL